MKLRAVPRTYLGLLVAVAACAQIPRIDPGLAPLIPPGAVMLMGVRMEALKSTPLYQKLLARQRLSDLDEFAMRTNFDPRKDVREMLVVSSGTDMLVIARGAFRPNPLKSVAQTRYKGATFYGKGEGAFAILDPATAIAGPEAAVRKAIDGKGAGGGKLLLDRARNLPASAQVWFVMDGWSLVPDQAVAQAGNLASFGRILRTMQTTSGYFDLKSGVQGVIEGECKTSQDAKTLSDAARGLVGMGRLSVPEGQPELLRFWDGIKAEQKDRALRINVQIAPDLLDAFLTMTENSGRPRIAPKKK
jgi:hypothetical protein